VLTAEECTRGFDVLIHLGRARLLNFAYTRLGLNFPRSKESLEDFHDVVKQLCEYCELISCGA
jgi:hypothetical protein